MLRQVSSTAMYHLITHLGHLDDSEDLMKGTNDTARAEKDKDGFCIHYEEDLEYHFLRIIGRLDSEDPTFVLHPEEVLS